MTDVRALTIKQPHAALVAAGLKGVENRSWPLPAGYSGPLLIHAGKADDADGWRAVGEALEGFKVVYGAFVAVAMNVTCHWGETCCTDRGGELRSWHWTLTAVTPIEPVPATGRLRLWTPEPEAVSACLAGSQRLG
ncbi:hypothetical protein OG742_11340 [Streptomyces sp. NBC_00828]|uniref:hypothetical protein n=1 Tax=Streptomyces sp. NBC_00828 TaxID=2903678 RepID=UPI00386D92DC